MLKATKVRLYPTSEQQKALAFQFGAMRWAYNFALDWRSSAYKERGERISKHQAQARLVELKAAEDTKWLKDADSQALQQAVMHLDDAFQRFFRKHGRYPRFKSKHGKQSMSYPQRVKVVDGNRLYLPKIGAVRAVLHRELTGKIKTVTVSRTQTGKFYASVLCDDGVAPLEPLSSIDADLISGIDLGLTHLAIESTGRKHKNPRFLKRAAQNLRRKQKSLSRKKKGSANRNKARVIVAKAYERTSNARNDFQHKLSRRLIDENQAVCVETLKVKNMLKNRKLSKHIADASWGELLRKLQYKAAWAGKHLVKIDQWFASSKTCSACGHKAEAMTLDVRHWTCPRCHTEHDRDINAAENIRQQGIIRLRRKGCPSLLVEACVTRKHFPQLPEKQEASSFRARSSHHGERAA